MFQVLRKGSTGPEVEKWQNFLRGRTSNSSIVADAVFGNITELETKAFQSSKGLIPDGVVGPKTLAIAISSGFPAVLDSSKNINGPNWPQQPPHGPLSFLDREKLFGKFSYVSSPTYANPEAITITSNWTSNISQVSIHHLRGIAGVPKSSTIQFHSLLIPQITKLFNKWHDEGLTYLILSWGGSWVPRFVRGSRTSLSNHAWGTAFDINVQWNMLGAQPALRGETGSVRELVEIAYEYGFYWGGWFANRPDGMHFEAYKIL